MANINICDYCETQLEETAIGTRGGGEYCSVLCAKLGEEVVGVDSTHASPEVLDLLANLARRVTELERKLEETQAHVDMVIGDVALLDDRTQVVNSIQDFYGGVSR